MESRVILFIIGLLVLAVILIFMAKVVPNVKASINIIFSKLR